MTERSLTKKYDPLRHFVNNVSDLDPNIFNAYQQKDGNKIKELLDNGLKTDYEVFICVNKDYHAAVLCCANDLKTEERKIWPQLMSEDPFDVPELAIVHQFELCYESEELQTYRIRKKLKIFKDVQDKIHKAYYIGHYTNVSFPGLQLAALRAAPHRYNVMLEDCVEFAKEFCVQLLAYCNNWKELEADVDSRIKKATATGLSAEELSRRVRSSARAMNKILGGVEMSSWFSEVGGKPLLLGFLLVYPVLVGAFFSFLTWYLLKA